jgi:hypothetical protein
VDLRAVTTPETPPEGEQAARRSQRLSAQEAAAIVRTLGACPSIRPHSRLPTDISLGFGLFGLSPALGAHRSPQLAATPQARRQIFSRLCVKQISCHSAETFSKPRSRNVRMPRADLIWPNTGSTMCLRAA